MRGSMLGVMIATACALVGEARPAEACSPWPAGVQRRDVMPGDGAVDVPTNARVVVTYETTDGSIGEITLRVQGGAEVAVPAERVRNDGWHVSLELAAALEPSTTYEVLDRLDLGCAWGSEAECLGDPVVIATFTTGTGPDTTPPVLVGVDADASFLCLDGSTCYGAPDLALHDVAIDAIVDDQPASWIRYEYLDSEGQRVAGPTALRAAAQTCGGGSQLGLRPVVGVPQVFQVRAIDLAGNVETTAHLLSMPSCAELAAGTACEPAAADSGGCHVGAPGSGGLAILLGVALFLPSRRRLAALLVVAPTWVAFDARPAEACLPWPRGITGRGVLPESGAGDVPTNARVLVTYVGVDGFTGEVSLRVQGGALVPATITVVPGGGFSASLEIDAELQPLTTYEVLDRLDLECAFNTWNACLGDPVVISTFTTGTAVDTEPPRLVDLLRVESNAYCGGLSATGCYEPSLVTHEFELGAAEDDGPERWIQYEYLDGAGAVVARVGPLHTAALHCGGSGEPWWGTVVYVPEAFEIRAVDLAGNAELVAHGPFTASCAVLDEDACGPSPPDAGSGQPPDASGDPATSGGGGCAAAASPGGWLLLLALAVLLARRRRIAGALLVVVPTWVAVDARPAEACSPWPAGVFDRTVIPESGATEVPTNARVTVSYDTHGGNPGSTLTLRPQGGEPVEATTLDAYGWGNHRTVIPTQSLLPGTVYEVLDTLDLACAMDGAPDCSASRS